MSGFAQRPVENGHGGRLQIFGGGYLGANSPRAVTSPKRPSVQRRACSHIDRFTRDVPGAFEQQELTRVHRLFLMVMLYPCLCGATGRVDGIGVRHLAWVFSARSLQIGGLLSTSKPSTSLSNRRHRVSAQPSGDKLLELRQTRRNTHGLGIGDRRVNP